MFFSKSEASIFVNYLPYYNVSYFCPQEATAEEVEFDDEEVVEEVDDNKDYWVLWTGYYVHYDG